MTTEKRPFQFLLTKRKSLYVLTCALFRNKALYHSIAWWNALQDPDEDPADNEDPDADQ